MCKMDWIKRFILQFTVAKQRLSEKHEFALVLLGSSAIIYQPFTGDWTKIADKLTRLHTSEDYNQFDCNSLFDLW